MMRLMSLKQYMKMSKPALIRKITKTLRKLPKKKLCMFCYELSKSKLPTLKATKQLTLQEIQKERKRFHEKMAPIAVRIERLKTKRKFSRKQLAAQRLFAKRAKAGTLRRR